MHVHDWSTDSLSHHLQPNKSTGQQSARSSELRYYASDVLTSRSAYRSCHIQTDDSDFRIPAIQIDGIYYSFFRVKYRQEDAIDVLQKLHARGDVSVVTVIPKGYAIWILETGAIAASDASTLNTHLASHHHPNSLPQQQLDPLQNSKNPYRILTSRRQYTMVKAYIGGIDRPVSVVSFQGQFYSLFKTVRDIKQTAQIVKKISDRGSRTLVTRMPQGYGVWILEKTARPIDP